MYDREGAKDLAIILAVCIFWLVVYVLLLQITAFAIWGGAYWLHAGLLSTILLFGANIRSKKGLRRSAVIDCVGAILLGHIGLATLITYWVIQWWRKRRRQEG